MQSKDSIALRKRTQITRTNKMMFVWIAVASVLVGIGAVMSIYLVQKLVYNERVLTEKQKTISTLEKNIAVIPELQQATRVLDTNTALMSVRLNDEQQPIQVILDALPSEANSLALGASLQGRLLAGIEGLTIESLSPQPVIGVETLTDSATVDAASGTTANEINFQFSVSGSPVALRQVLTNLERSIRTIHVTSIRIESQAASQTMAVQAKAFYEQAKVVQLVDKVVKP